MKHHTGTGVPGGPTPTSAPVETGSFQSSSRADSRAALMRNVTWFAGPAWRTWDSGSAAAPEAYPVEVKDGEVS